MMEERILLRTDLQFFAKDGPGGEKTEEPTTKKLTDARKKGQVARSQELSHAVSLLTMFLILKLWGVAMGENFLNIFRWIYPQVPDILKTTTQEGEISYLGLTTIINTSIIRMILIMLPIFLSVITVSFVVNVAQVKWQVSFEPMKPKFDKLSPLSGMKRLFSVEKLAELLKSVLKIVLISAVVYNYMKERLGFIFLLLDYTIPTALGFTAQCVVDMGIRISMVYLILGVADLFYSRKKFHDDMMMTKQEVKDEYKNSEGDPQIKGKIRQRMMEASRRRMMQAVPEADVVITNPTHYAVALKYDLEAAPAPVVVAKGVDFLAEKIKQEAREHDIEIVENKPLARMLYANVEIGEAIPQELYQAVAEVIAYVYNLKNKEVAAGE